MSAAKQELAWDFSFPAIDGGTLDLRAFAGRVLLVVNTASFCGYTNQYKSLRELHHAREAEGLTVVGVPSQDFNQESPDNETIRTFCETRFAVDFPMAGVSPVTGPSAAPFYAWVHQAAGWQPSWNFNKVLVARDGSIAGTFGSGDDPGGQTLGAAITAALTKPPAHP